MKKVLKITVELENDAFASPMYRSIEATRILHKIIHDIKATSADVQSHLIYDINGNQVGQWSIKGK